MLAVGDWLHRVCRCYTPGSSCSQSRLGSHRPTDRPIDQSTDRSTDGPTAATGSSCCNALSTRLNIDCNQPRATRAAQNFKICQTIRVHLVFCPSPPLFCFILFFLDIFPLFAVSVSFMTPVHRRNHPLSVSRSV